VYTIYVIYFKKSTVFIFYLLQKFPSYHAWTSVPDPWHFYGSVTFLRVRICGSVPVDYGSGSWSFFSGFQNANTKKNFFLRVFCLLLVTFTSVFKYEVLKVWKSRFLLFFCLLIGGSRSGSVQIITDPDP
jgi:hypothetical protein